ncbi:hypothetical protein [Enhygromyxa salina]|uniref:Uncharacterized protein n=1 Tax=Enhygromyxa salina TaxID=215803 RepID=A0A2S9YPK2_9BACT|nr:hypothetical protein [Enhygromyxa salina]PRQ07021.1 hypothetical protein ENSA7_32450 [Enhygromyxa salina]
MGRRNSKPKNKRGTRAQRFGWTYGGLILLAFAAPAPLFGLLEAGGGWGVAGCWVVLHAILAAYVHVQNRTLPRFHPAGFGKPSDPGFRERGFTKEHPPTRSKWELALFLLAGWMIVGIGPAMPDYPSWIAPSFVSLLGLSVGLLAYRYDHKSARDARRLLGAQPIRDATHASEGRLVGTVVGERSAKPVLWREVLEYAWSESQQVTKDITDSNGNPQTVQVTETSHYSCGLRRERELESLRLDTELGIIEVPLRGLVWAAERELSFGRRGEEASGWRPPKPKGQAIPDRTRAVALERIHAGDRVAVLGELRREQGRIVGGKDSAAVLFAAGGSDPQVVLRRALLGRRALLAAMVLLGVATFMS